jgi:hypothetical protein
MKNLVTPGRATVNLRETSFGMMHLATKRFVRCSPEEGCVFHRLNKVLTETTYRSLASEIHDTAPFFETAKLAPILGIIAGTADVDSYEWEDWNDGDWEEWPEIDDDLCAFVPVAFVRDIQRVGGTGDRFSAGMKIMLVTPKDETGEKYELSEIPKS